MSSIYECMVLRFVVNGEGSSGKTKSFVGRVHTNGEMCR